MTDDIAERACKIGGTTLGFVDHIARPQQSSTTTRISCRRRKCWLSCTTTTSSSSQSCGCYHEELGRKLTRRNRTTRRSR